MLLTSLLAGCAPAPDSATGPRGAAPAVAPAAPALRRLTQQQYLAAVEDLLGEGLALPTSLEPDSAVDGLYSVGAASTTLSPVGVEDYEDAAYDLAEQVVADPDRVLAVLGCTPGSDGCLESGVATFGRRAWRRTLTTEEVARVVAVGEAAEAALDADAGATYAIATLLQSPYFLYRVEIGEPDPDDATLRRYTSTEMATRLAFFLWNTTPDDALIDAGEAGDLATDAGLASEVDRLLDDERAHAGVRALFADMLTLDGLDDLAQDPTLFTHMSPDLGPSAREETLLGIEALVFEDSEGWPSFFTTRRTFLDDELAALYNVQSPARDGFAETELDADGGRAGFLGQASFLALQAHPTATSATRRGMFVREVLLCQPIPPPPADVDASIPEPDTDSPTLRERMEVHRTDPSCASCHTLTDVIGLGFENFDAVARWRTTENGATIDPSGDLDGEHFADAVGLGKRVAAHERLGPCLAETVYRYATARSVGEGEEALVDWHAAGLAESGDSVRWLLRDIATSPGFRTAGELE